MPVHGSSLRQPHVALIIETSKIYGREILLGISKYMRLHGTWSIFTTERGQDDPDPSWLRNWPGEGIITRSLDMSLCRAASSVEIPTSGPDFDRIAEIAAEMR